MLLIAEIFTISMLILFIVFYVVGKSKNDEGLKKAGKIFLMLFIFSLIIAFIVGLFIGVSISP